MKSALSNRPPAFALDVVGLDLYVVADHSRALPTCRHRARIRIGHRDLTIWQRLELFLYLVKAMHLPTKLRDLLAQSSCLEFYLRWLCAIRSLQRAQIPLDAFLDLLLALVDLASSEIAVPSIDCLELAAVDGDQGLREQL